MDKKKRVRTNIIILGVIAFIVLAIWLSNSSSSSDSSLEFDQIGYYKEEDTKFRLFTFNVSGFDTLSADVHKELEKHAKSQTRTEGAVTYVFFYHRNAPDITTSANADIAWDVAMSKSPISWGGYYATGDWVYDIIEE